MAAEKKMQRRRFLKTVWGGAVLFGSGLLGFPFGACSSDGARPTADDLKDLDLDALPEMTAAEIEEFVGRVDQAAADYLETHGPDQIGDTSVADLQDQQSPSDAVDSQSPNDTDLMEDIERPRLPPGQHLLEVIPVMAQNPAPRTLQEWRFTVRGEVQQELEFTWEEFQQLPQVEQVSDIHCVTTWSVFDVPFSGVRVSHLLALAGLTEKSRFVVFDCEHGYTTNVDLPEVMKDNVLIATRIYGEDLPVKYGGPARGLIPERYYYKSGKWVTGIRILEQDEPGFWESRGYSNTADPWTEDRFD